ncbi:hypothetical protein AAF134_01060 [Synechococcus lacustris Tous-12m]
MSYSVKADSLPSGLGSAQLDLFIIVYRPCAAELQAMGACLAALAPGIRYSMALNAVQPQLPEGLEPLLAGALIVQYNSENLGYGKAANRLFEALPQPAPGLRCSTPICIGSQAALKLCWVGLHPSRMWLQPFPRSSVPRGKWNV